MPSGSRPGPAPGPGALPGGTIVMHDFLRLIEAKRDGHELGAADLNTAVRAIAHNEVPDYQTAAWLMAAYLRGLSPDETRALTLAMRDSGEVLHFAADPRRPVVDKHSTGGIGDKVSLALAPLLASLGFRVPMISGRGLGITGGTLDKLESIPGLTTRLKPDRLLEQTEFLGAAFAGQTATMVPADRKLYALRDVTGTVPSIPLITASILSKKLAEGISALVMDVKFGRAAFMPDLASARRLATSLVDLAGACGVQTRALLTCMDRPLGHSAGNWLEVREAVECLAGRGPADLRHLVIACAASLLLQTGRAPDPTAAEQTATNCLDGGQPMQRWREILVAQGADLNEFDRRLREDHRAPVVIDIVSPGEGWIHAVDARVIGEVVRDLGGGRFRQEDTVDPDVGVDRLVQVGDRIQRGDLLCRIHARTSDAASAAGPRVDGAFHIGTASVPVPEVVVEQLAGA